MSVAISRAGSLVDLHKVAPAGSALTKFLLCSGKQRVSVGGQGTYPVCLQAAVLRSIISLLFTNDHPVLHGIPLLGWL